MMVGTKEYIYKQVNGVELTLRIYSPTGYDLNEKRPAVVFYFGGGWQTGTIDHFSPQSEFLASKGFIAITPEYRIRSKHNTTPFECVEDAKDALFWVWQHGDQLGINPDRIAVAGGSAGGHLAACTAILKSESFDSRGVYRIPKAMVLFNPVGDTSENGYGVELFGERKLELSPLHNVTKELPPTLVFHGTKDNVVPYVNAVNFCNRMQEFGNACTLIAYEGRGHGFFNRGRSENDIDYLDTQEKMYLFLKEKLAPE